MSFGNVCYIHEWGHKKMVYLETRSKLLLTLSIVQHYIKVLIIGIRDWAELLYFEIWDQDFEYKAYKFRQMCN
jgi:hypothetical protein